MKKDTIYASDFKCKTVLKLLERCNSCPKEGKCKERSYLKAIINGNKEFDYQKKKEHTFSFRFEDGKVV